MSRRGAHRGRSGRQPPRDGAALRTSRLERLQHVPREGPTKFRLRRKPMFDDLDVTGLTDLNAPSLTWDFIRRLKDHTDMKVLIKGHRHTGKTRP